ncbi:MAG: hypothetical protein M0C28_18285 [Candidatus Moduliflexus flocculans]|nr:hypothetical protein [Candidatus Moduliflexus flocculans]
MYAGTHGRARRRSTSSSTTPQHPVHAGPARARCRALDAVDERAARRRSRARRRTCIDLPRRLPVPPALPRYAMARAASAEPPPLRERRAPATARACWLRRSAPASTRRRGDRVTR